MYVPFKTKKERDKYGAEVSVLTKVKELAFLEDGESMTRSMVADYYEVKDYEIKSIVKIYKRELQENGLEVLTGKGLIAFKKAYLSDSSQNEDSSHSLEIFSPKAVLRIGLLLKDSVIAVQIRKAVYNKSLPVVRYLRNNNITSIEWSQELEDLVFDYTERGLQEGKTLKSLHKYLSEILGIETKFISNRWYNTWNNKLPLKKRLGKELEASVARGEHLHKNALENRVNKLEEELRVLKIQLGLTQEVI
ncbi:hypothetical protein [Bacillus subtilis]|uniref:hypothetical protein n=1 Tax=Bacillus subtilis TaxID=1423 RepID=UPI0031F561B8